MEAADTGERARLSISTPRLQDLPQESDFRGISDCVRVRPQQAEPRASTREPQPRIQVPAMPPTNGTQRTIDAPRDVFEMRGARLATQPIATQPGSAPIATTIVLFVVVAALLGFIAWL